MIGAPLQMSVHVCVCLCAFVCVCESDIGSVWVQTGHCLALLCLVRVLSFSGAFKKYIVGQLATWMFVVASCVLLHQYFMRKKANKFRVDS